MVTTTFNRQCKGLLPAGTGRPHNAEIACFVKGMLLELQLTMTRSFPFENHFQGIVEHLWVSLFPFLDLRPTLRRTKGHRVYGTGHIVILVTLTYRIS